MRGTPARAVLLLLLLTSAWACGGAANGGSGGVVELGEKDAGKTVQVRVGDVVKVRLDDQFPFPGSSLRWSVSSSEPSVLELTSEMVPSPGLAAGSLPYEADFVVRAAGGAQLIAHGATTCEAMAKPACPDRQFTIEVVATG